MYKTILFNRIDVNVNIKINIDINNNMSVTVQHDKIYATHTYHCGSV